MLITLDEWDQLQAQVKEDLEQGYEADYSEAEEEEEEGEKLEEEDVDMAD